MALAWPLTIADFFGALPISRITFRLGTAMTTSTTGGGEVIAHRLGARLWRGEIVLGIDRHAAQRALEARIALLEEPGASLLLYDTRQPFPIADPGGTLLGAATPRIHSFLSNNRELRLKDLPAGYTISQGDTLAFTYGDNPARYAYHRVVTGSTADGTGVTDRIELAPVIRPGATIDAAVALVRPVCKARLVSAEYGTGRATVSDGATLEWTQTLR